MTTDKEKQQENISALSEAPQVPHPMPATLRVFIMNKLMPYIGHMEIIYSITESMGQAVTLITFLHSYPK